MQDQSGQGSLGSQYAQQQVADKEPPALLDRVDGLEKNLTHVATTTSENIAQLIQRVASLEHVTRNRPGAATSAVLSGERRSCGLGAWSAPARGDARRASCLGGIRGEFAWRGARAHRRILVRIFNLAWPSAIATASTSARTPSWRRWRG